MKLELFPDIENQSLSVPNRKRCGRIVLGDARQELAKLKAGIAQSCITSPPYWGLRDYGIAGQIGAEMNLDDYIRDLVAIFAVKNITEINTKSGKSIASIRGMKPK